MKTNPFVKFFQTTAVALLMVTTVVHAEDKKSDATGTWTWSVPGRNGGPDRTNTLTLKVEGDKLSGKVTAPGREGKVAETAITEGKVAGDSISFNLVREFNGNSSTIKYTGKVSADKITGKTESTRDGQVQSRDWEAKRSAEAK